MLLRQTFILLIAILATFTSAQCIEGQQPDDQLYYSAMERYESKDFEKAAQIVVEFLGTSNPNSFSQNRLYNCACILALGGQPERALQLLSILATEHTYSNLEHIQNDSDLASLRDQTKWRTIIEQVRQNKETQPSRTRALIRSELLKAKSLLQQDDGKLWGHQIWSTDILILDFDNTVYSLEALPDCQSDGILFYKTIEPNKLSFTNSAQTFNEKRYAVVMVNYIDDNSSTIIHELFHVLQLSNRQFRSDPVEYLDNHDARIWMRLEFQALRNGLRAADAKQKRTVVESWLQDAVLFRKLRQTKYKAYLQDELEIETLEGMANYTGIVLSSAANKFEEAIDELNGREQAATYTRPFPYATGPAYGLLFDNLGFDWKADMQAIYNFLEIYEANLGKQLSTDVDLVRQAKARNNYETIREEELKKKLIHEKNVEHYTRTLLNQPTLRAKVSDGIGSYSMSFNMNGTMVLENHGIVYSHIKGTDLTGNNFGNFHSTGDDKLGAAGILRLTNGGEYVFPFPTKIDGGKITGEHYEINLNDGWQIRKSAETGDLQIVPSESSSDNVED